ncbi:MAG: MFS transporter [Devosia sp.]
MASSVRAGGVSPELRASLFHFTVFGTTGVASAYLPVWLTEKGLNSSEIGIVNAVPVLLTLVTGLLIGRVADRASDWRVVIIALALIAGVAPFALPLVREFWGLLLVITLAVYPVSAMVPVVDAATLRMTERRGTDFGFVRAWGTIGYMIASALTGAVIGWVGAITFVPMFIAWGLARAAISLPLPRFRAPEDVDAPKRSSSGVKLISLLKPWFLLPCIAFALIQATHFFLGAMGALVWQIDGIGAGWFGPLIAVSAAGEATTMFLWRRIGRTMSARTMLIVAGLVACVRWSAMALSPSLPVLFALQALHAITLPFSYFGIMHFIANWVPEDIAAEAQGFSSALTMGVCVLTLVAFGWLIGLIGGQAYFVAAGMGFAAAILAWLSLVLRPAYARSEVAAHG